MRIKRTTTLFTLCASAVLALFAIIMSVRPVAAVDLVLTDFEGGTPGGWFVYQGVQFGATGAVTPTVTTIASTDPLARPGQTGNNDALCADANVGNAGDFAGFGSSVPAANQDWSGYTSIDFWLYGTGAGQTYQFEVQTAAGNANRVSFTESGTLGWQQISIPIASLTGTFDITQVTDWVFVLDGVNGNFCIDDVTLIEPPMNSASVYDCQGHQW